MKINPKLTPGRIRVLEFLEKNPGHFAHGEGAATLHCLQLGWADYARNDRDDIIGQHLTDQGRAILSAHRLAQIAKPNPIICHHDCFLGCKMPQDCKATNSNSVASMQRSGIEGANHA